MRSRILGLALLMSGLVVGSPPPADATGPDFSISPGSGPNGSMVTATMLQPCPVVPEGATGYVEFRSPWGRYASAAVSSDGTWAPTVLESYEGYNGDLASGVHEYRATCRVRYPGDDHYPIGVKTLQPVPFTVTGPNEAKFKISGAPTISRGQNFQLASLQPCRADAESITFWYHRRAGGTYNGAGGWKPADNGTFSVTMSLPDDLPLGVYVTFMSCAKANGQRVTSYAPQDIEVVAQGETTPPDQTPPVVPPVTPASRSLVALGDSYSSGEGNRPFLSNAPGCNRSATMAWPQLVAAQLKLRMAGNLACSGATTKALTAPFKNQSPQLDELKSKDAATFVTTTLGGNDLGFADVLFSCVLAPRGCVKNGRLAEARRDLITVENALVRSYGRIKQAAPTSRVVAVGYPNIMNRNVRNARLHCRWLGWDEGRELSRLANLVDAMTARAAARAGVAYVSTRDVLAGHELCTGKAWVISLKPRASTQDRSASGHPNAAGQTAIARSVATSISRRWPAS